jgi:hypothetical protein
MSPLLKKKSSKRRKPRPKSKPRSKSKSRSKSKPRSKPRSKSKSRSKKLKFNYGTSKPRIKRNTSNSKLTWEKFLKNEDSKKALQKSWNSKNPQTYYRKTIKKLARKYSN